MGKRGDYSVTDLAYVNLFCLLVDRDLIFGFKLSALTSLGTSRALAGRWRQEDAF